MKENILLSDNEFSENLRKNENKFQRLSMQLKSLRILEKASLTLFAIPYTLTYCSLLIIFPYLFVYYICEENANNLFALLLILIYNFSYLLASIISPIPCFGERFGFSFALNSVFLLIFLITIYMNIVFLENSADFSINFGFSNEFSEVLWDSLPIIASFLAGFSSFNINQLHFLYLINCFNSYNNELVFTFFYKIVSFAMILGAISSLFSSLNFLLILCTFQAISVVLFLFLKKPDLIFKEYLTNLEKDYKLKELISKEPNNSNKSKENPDNSNGNFNEKINGNFNENIAGNYNENIPGNYNENIPGNYNENIQVNYNENIPGNYNEKIPGNYNENISKNKGNISKNKGNIAENYNENFEEEFSDFPLNFTSSNLKNPLRKRSSFNDIKSHLFNKDMCFLTALACLKALISSYLVLIIPSTIMKNSLDEKLEKNEVFSRFSQCFIAIGFSMFLTLFLKKFEFRENPRFSCNEILKAFSFLIVVFAIGFFSHFYPLIVIASGFLGYCYFLLILVIENQIFRDFEHMNINISAVNTANCIVKAGIYIIGLVFIDTNPVNSLVVYIVMIFFVWCLIRKK